jgi:hypothetical protein
MGHDTITEACIGNWDRNEKWWHFIIEWPLSAPLDLIDYGASKSLLLTFCYLDLGIIVLVIRFIAGVFVVVGNLTSYIRDLIVR